MSCETWRPLLDDFVDDEMDSRKRVALMEHLTSCEACRAEVDALRSLSALARDLPPVPAPSGFSAIEERLTPRTPPARTARPLLLLAAAAALVVVSVSGTVWVLDPPGPVASNPVPPPTSPDPVADLSRALAELEASLAEKPLDPEVRTLVEANLAIIDRAITETSEALSEHPDNALLQESLAALHHQKVSVLRRILRS